jgi:hypothetical protein
MGHFFMDMKMFMHLFTLRLLVFVPVMLVMDVRMSMRDGFMTVPVPVHFAVEKEHPRKHDQRCHPVLAR